VLGLLLWQISPAVGLGIAAGLVGARALSRFVGALLYGITPTNAAIYVGVSVVVMAITLLSVYPPSRRALRIDPRTAMGAE
jgi:putative ABC transport system permease protein